jgi:hypothetical protein
LSRFVAWPPILPSLAKDPTRDCPTARWNFSRRLRSGQPAQRRRLLIVFLALTLLTEAGTLTPWH